MKKIFIRVLNSIGLTTLDRYVDLLLQSAILAASAIAIKIQLEKEIESLKSQIPVTDKSVDEPKKERNNAKRTKKATVAQG